MSFDWNDYLTLAQELHQQSSSSNIKEAKLRSAISRAYYAAFIQARNFLLNQGQLLPSDGQVHRLVAEQFNLGQDLVWRDVGRKLRVLRLARNRADYDEVVHQLEATARRTLHLSNQVFELLKTL